MRKIEYIQIHALLAEVTQYLIKNEDMPAEALSTYHALGTSPANIHQSKQNHREAITVLNNTIEPWLEQIHTDSPEPSLMSTQ